MPPTCECHLALLIAIAPPTAAKGVASLSAAAHLGCLPIGRPSFFARAPPPCDRRRAEDRHRPELGGGKPGRSSGPAHLLCHRKPFDSFAQPRSAACARRYPVGPLATSPRPKRDYRVHRRALFVGRSAPSAWDRSTDRRESRATSTARSGLTRTRRSSSRHARNQCVAVGAPTAHALEQPRLGRSCPRRASVHHNVATVARDRP